MSDTELQDELLNEFYWLHRHPELSYEEFETTKRLRLRVEEAGIRVLELPLKTGFVAEIGHGKPVIALRTDIDALPITEDTGLPYSSETKGKMHACGHDFHMTSVLGATLLLKEHEDELKGTVRIIFQPAEEAPGGAKVVMQTGVLDDVQAIFGLHTLPTLDTGIIGVNDGAVTASVDRFVIHFNGKGTHGAHPDRGVDPVPMLAAFIAGVQTIVSRNLNPFHAGLVSVTHVEAGNTWNVIPETAMAEGTTRAMSTEDRALIKQRVYELAESTAKAYGGQAVIDWYAGPPATRNVHKWAELARKVGQEEHLKVIEAGGSLAGEDFAFYQEKIDGVFVLVGTGKSASNHNPKFKVDPTAILPTAKFLAKLVTEAFAEI